MPAQAAIDKVMSCLGVGIDVLGVEGFRCIGDRIQPQQEHSCDFEDGGPARHERLIEFLSDRLNSELWFEVVTDEVP